jgi:hypothetical protein
VASANRGLDVERHHASRDQRSESVVELWGKAMMLLLQGEGVAVSGKAIWVPEDLADSRLAAR